MPRPARPQPPRRPNPLSTIKPIRHATPIVRQAIQGAAKARRLCPNKTCTTPKIEDGVCVSCGTIIDESSIVAEVQFGENSSGAAVVQGSFVSADQGAAKSMGPAFNRAGGSEDREKTLREGKRMMQGFASEHHIPESVVNSGMQIFKLAAMQNFIQGRRLNMVAAVCLYTAARKEKPCRVMLIDFADSCQVNVFKLGHCFKALHEKLTVSKDGIQPILPEDLIYRFAARLEFLNETEKVAETAVRLVNRMSKDWIYVGRRPSGVCGACLILAARMHNFRRTVKEVVYIVKVTNATLQKRLDEFKVTASSDLTVDDFLRNSFLEAAHDPPSFYEQSEAYQSQKKTRKRKRPVELSEDENNRNDHDGQQTGNRASLPHELDPVLSIGEHSVVRDSDGYAIPQVPRRDASIPIDPYLLEDTDDPRALDDLVDKHGDVARLPTDSLQTEGSRARDVVDEEWEEDEAAIEDEMREHINEMINDPNTLEHSRAFASAEQRARVHTMIAHTKNPQREVPMTAVVEDEEFANDPEVENCILSPAEAAVKEQIWVNANKDWLRDQQQKIFKQKMAELGPPKATRKRIKKPRIGEGQTSAASSPGEAAVNALKERTWSKRINYDAIRGMFESSGALGSATTSRVTSRAGSTIAGSSRASSVAPSEPEEENASVAESDVASLSELGEGDGEDLDDSWKADFHRDMEEE